KCALPANGCGVRSRFGGAGSTPAGPIKCVWRGCSPPRCSRVPGREEDVAVVVAELSTNAVRHSRSGEGRGWFGLEVTLAEIAYIAVTDLGGGCVPTIRSET